MYIMLTKYNKNTIQSQENRNLANNQRIEKLVKKRLFHSGLVNSKLLKNY